MDQKEITRIKQGLMSAALKAPGNQILRDLEASVLTVEQLQEKLRQSNLQVDELRKVREELLSRIEHGCQTLDHFTGSLWPEEVQKAAQAMIDSFGPTDRLTDKKNESCEMRCLERWPDMGHRPDCPTRKCEKHGLTVCDECAAKRKCEVALHGAVIEGCVHKCGHDLPCRFHQ